MAISANAYTCRSSSHGRLVALATKISKYADVFMPLKFHLLSRIKWFEESGHDHTSVEPEDSGESVLEEMPAGD